jgi:hypothetical protein
MIFESMQVEGHHFRNRFLLTHLSSTPTNPLTEDVGTTA